LLYNGFHSRQVLISAANQTIKQAAVEFLQSASSAASAQEDPFADLDMEEVDDCLASFISLSFINLSLNLLL